MNQADSIARDGFLSEIGLEAVKLCGIRVAAVVNAQPVDQMMMDEGYLKLEPVTVEVLKGEASSLEVIDIDGEEVAEDLRGLVPVKNSQAKINGVAQNVVSGVARKIETVQNSGSRWIVTTILLNV